MKTGSEKSSTTSSTSAQQASKQPFLTKASGGGFLEPTVQMKMTVNRPGDKFEQEADRMAEKVVRMPEEKVQKAETERIQKAGAPEEKIRKAEDERLQKADMPEEQVQKAAMPEEKIQKAEEEQVQKADMPDEQVQKAEDEKLQKQEEEPVQRKSGDGAPAVNANTQSAIRQKSSGGQPLAADVRSYMEPRFGADFSQVRIHNDQEAAGLSNQLSARAFTYQNNIFFSRDQYKPETSEGKQLLAHELTHTIQQGHAIQRSTAVTTTASPPPIQRLGVSDALDYFADKAYYIPGFRMLTIVLGFNPINGARTDRSAANILRAVIELIPGGAFITQALENHGVFAEAGAWIEQQLSTLGDIGSQIVSGLNRFLDSLSWRDIFDLGGVWDRAKRIFTDPIGRLISFGKGVVKDLLTLVKNAILRPLAALAQGTRGYDLLRALLGEDPITGEPVPRTPDTVIGGFMKLIGQEEVWENIKRGNAIQRAWAWFQGVLAGLMNFVRTIPGRIISTITSLTFRDIITVAGAFVKVVKSFANIAFEFISWGINQVIGLLEILFDVVAPGIMPYIRKAKSAFNTILKNPIAFVGNLIRAAKLGFRMFANNILEHLKTALIKWLVGPLAAAGVYIPKSFSLLEIVKLILSVLNLTWTNIRKKLLKFIPEPVLQGLEKTFDILVTLVKEGPAAAWEKIKGELIELKDMLISEITGMVVTQIVKAAVTKLVTMFNPVGAVIQAIIAIYDTITFFIERIKQIAAVVGSFIDSIAAIAAGKVGAAARKVESTMANTLVVVLAFLARFARLGGIPKKIVGIIRRIRKPIDKALDKIVGWIMKVLKGAKDKVVSLFMRPRPFKAGKGSHRLFADGDEVMLASSPARRLGNALTTFRTNDPPPSAATLKLIQSAHDKGSQLKKNIVKKDPKLLSKNEELRDDIVSLLIRIMYETGGTKKKKMAPVTITFEAKGNKGEFNRQLKLQETEINKMQVGDWQKNRARFVAFGRNKKEDTASERKAALTQKLVNNPKKAISALESQGLLKASSKARLEAIFSDPNIPAGQKDKAAASIIKQIMDSYSGKNLAVLHTLDQVAGGAATIYGDDASIFGGRYENSTIGSQWYPARIAIIDKATLNVDPKVKIKSVTLKS
ncbi:MAG: DUF4157 domain-containing protein [Bacteroidetes bacterium]|nr:MAG: DUF4157 domain-containing protein [Bacteroidota bacterium]